MQLARQRLKARDRDGDPEPTGKERGSESPVRPVSALKLRVRLQVIVLG